MGDQCVGLDADECGSTFGDDGAQLCGYNTMTDDCYEVVMTAGTRGKGNFDDGYTAAQAQADEQTAQLYTAIGILGGIMGILVLTVLGGGYYIYSNKKDIEYQHTPVTMDVIDVDGGSTRTKGHHMRIQSHSQHYTSDSMPMLDTMQRERKGLLFSYHIITSSVVVVAGVQSVSRMLRFNSVIIGKGTAMTTTASTSNSKANRCRSDSH